MIEFFDRHSYDKGEIGIHSLRPLGAFIDDFSRKVWVFFLKEKSEVFDYFKIWKKLLETQTGKRVKRLRTDNGLEFCNRQFDNFCAAEGIL